MGNMPTAPRSFQLDLGAVVAEGAAYHGRAAGVFDGGDAQGDGFARGQETLDERAHVAQAVL